jgi:VWFA-related protein
MRNATQRILVALLVPGLCLSPSSAGQQQSSGPSSGATRASQPSDPSPNQASQTPAAAHAPPPATQILQPGETSVIRTSSDLVRIDVEVTDGSGKPVRGLRADQFSITDDGQPQKVSIFSYEDIEAVETAGEENTAPIVVPVDSPTPAAAQAAGDQVRDRRMLVLLFDMTSMATADLTRAHDAADQFVKQQMSKADLVAVVTFGSNLKVLANFTNDRPTLERAIARLIPGVSSQIAGPFYASAQSGESDVQQDTGAAYTPDETEFNVFNTDQKLEAIEGLANVLGAIPGRKAIIEFTGGITQTGEENRTQLRAATDAANRADVSIYSIEARGLMAALPGGDATADAAAGTSLFTGASVYHQTDQREDSRDTLATLSTDTGGRAFFDLGDLNEAFPRIEQDNTGYYLVGYYLGSSMRRDGSWRTVRVRVNAPGARVRYRNGYYAPRDFQHLEREDRQRQLAEAMRSDHPVVELPIAVETAMFRLDDQQVYVPISAKLSSTALDWAQKHGRREAAFDFAAEVRAVPSGQSVAQLQDTINVRLGEQRFEQVRQSNLVYQGGVVLSPGSYRLKFLARENESGKIGTFEQGLIVPPRPPSRITLSSVLLSNQLVPVEKSSEVQSKGQGVRAKFGSSPLEMEGRRIVPSVTRFFTQQQTLYVFFQAYYPEKSDSFDPSALRAGLIFFRNGAEVDATPLLGPAAVDAKNHTASFRISLPLAKLPAGRYTVEAVVIGAGTQQSAFGRAYLALEASAPAAQPASAVPSAGAPTTPAQPRPLSP